MAAYRGLILKLKDKETCVTNKLKLAKFAWATEAVHIPNKHQQILDFICGLLVNRKKHNLTNKDVVMVWETLDKLLELAGAAAVVKPSILQAVTEDLRPIIHQKMIERSGEFLLLIVGSARKLLSLTSVTTFQFESLCSLLSVTCQLLAIPNFNPDQSTSLEALQTSLLDLLVRQQRSHLNQMQVLSVITDKVLSSSIRLLSQQSCPRLQEFLLGCLLHKDHQEMYALYLRQTFGEQEHSHLPQAPKHLGNIFTMFSTLLNEVDAAAFMSLLPEFVRIFVSQNRSDTRICYLMLKHLVQIVMGPADGKNTHQSWLLGLVASCMSACHDCDFFGSFKETGDVLRWFCQLTETVLQGSRSPAWFSLMRATLGHNVLVIEKFWEKILQLGFTRADQISQDCYIEQDLFLSDLVSMYMKLRRSSDLLSVLLSSIEAAATGSDVFGHLPHFYDRLGQMFSQAPTGTFMDMWESVQIFSVKMVDSLKDKPDDPKVFTCLHWTISLYTVLLANARLFDHHIFGVWGQKVLALIGQLEEHVIAVLHKKKGIFQQCPSFKDLLSVFVMAKILLFPKWRASAEIVASGNKTADGSNTQEDILLKVSRKLEPIDRLRLVVQRSSLASAAKQELAEDHKKRQAGVESIVQELLAFPPLTKNMVLTVWNFKIDGSSLLEQPVCRFWQLARMFPLVGSQLPLTVITRLAELVVDVLSLVTLEDLSSAPSPGTNLLREVEDFLAHPATREIRMFQETLSITIWRHLLSGVESHAASAKKKKKKADTEAELSMLSVVINLVTQDQIPDGQCLKLDLKQFKGDVSLLQHYPVLLQVLRGLDLEYLPDVNLRCQLGSCIFLACLDKSYDHEQFRKSVIDLLIRCLGVPNLSRLFEFVDPTDLLDFVMRDSLEENATNGLLMEVTVHAIMIDFQAVRNMVQYTKQMTGDLFHNSEVINLNKLKAVAWIIKNCRRYLSKSYYMMEARTAALEIFFSLAKFLVKHGLDWFHKAKLASTAIKIDLQVETPKAKKRKQDQHAPQPLVLSASSFKAAWCSLLDCFTEILEVWSLDIVDSVFNKYLDHLVGQILTQSMQDLESDSTSPETKITALRLITSSCHCHLRSRQAHSKHKPLLETPPESESDQTLTPQVSHDFSLFSEDKLKEVWTSCLSLCTKDFTKFLNVGLAENVGIVLQHTHCVSMNKTSFGSLGTEKSHIVSDKRPEQSLLRQGRGSELMGETTVSHSPGRAGKNWAEQAECWPRSVTAYLDVLQALMECSAPSTFKELMNTLRDSLLPVSDVQPGTVYVVIAVWRRLIKSQLLPDDHIQEMFAGMYQFLSVMLGLLEFQENLKSASLVSASTPAVFSPSESEQTRMSAMRGALRFVMEALSDFVDLGKTDVTPRMILVCLSAGVTFTLACPLDLDTLYRLINSMLVHHTNTVLTAAPSIVHLANKFVSACIDMGSNTKMTTRPEVLKEVLHSAQMTTRLLTLLSTPAFKTELAKVAHFILAEYVLGVQRGSLHTSIKQELARGLFKVMSMCDKYRLSALNISLPAGVRDTFKLLNQDYKKHRYDGFV